MQKRKARLSGSSAWLASVLLLVGTVSLGLNEVAAEVEKPPEIPTTFPSVAYYPNCDVARAAGGAPLHVGEPAYRRELDPDGDGVACEPYLGS